MLCLSGFELYSRWVPPEINAKMHLLNTCGVVSAEISPKKKSEIIS